MANRSALCSNFVSCQYFMKNTKNNKINDKKGSIVTYQMIEFFKMIALTLYDKIN